MKKHGKTFPNIYIFSFKSFYFLILLFGIFLTVANAQTNKKVDLVKKIEDATPSALPQSPVVEKLKSDAEDNNLKGRVKSVIEDVQDSPKSKLRRESEDYYNEVGNSVKAVSYQDGFPLDVTVYGYIDGNRVSKFNFIQYAEGERPPSTDIIAAAVDNPRNPNTPKDPRFSMRYKYKYNETGRLTEEWSFINNGELWLRNVYNYKGNQREKLDYGADGSQNSQTIEILDKDGNVIEEDFIDEKGKVSDKTTFTYQFDKEGNWIVKKAFENKKVRGKMILKPWYTSYRTITYHP